MSRPMITSQIDVCPIPFKYDTYTGCENGCRYCFARQLIEFSRRKSDRSPDRVEPTNIEDFFKFWNSKKEDPEHMFIQERIPLKIGGFSDPFPSIEIQQRNTFRALKFLDEYDYPVHILTKNPSLLCEYLDKFDNPNWSIGVSIFTLDEKTKTEVEPNSPKIEDRLKSIKIISDCGYHVMVKIQPVVYPIILRELDNMIDVFSSSGAWAFNTESLKIRMSDFPNTKEYFNEMNKPLGYDVRDFYRRNGKSEGIDTTLSGHLKMNYIRKCIELSKVYKIKYFVADNNMGKLGDGPECCGTEVLRDYKLWGGCNRIGYWRDYSKCSDNLYGLKIKTNSFSGKVKILRRPSKTLDDW